MDKDVDTLRWELMRRNEELERRVSHLEDRLIEVDQALWAAINELNRVKLTKPGEEP